ncbi:Hypothetical protein SMAX5B_018712 [Scophthalmus maximus]|uniref:Uncharacterized protein n=1 Tax=Scophthalmus maximus TaxID=52904 RepID=A0A2U9B2Z7_SCOMX|nr:Hypothetical protein SMAX5B_018712 [Scophthalmus maximus]
MEKFSLLSFFRKLLMERMLNLLDLLRLFVAGAKSSENHSHSQCRVFVKMKRLDARHESKS